MSTSFGGIFDLPTKEARLAALDTEMASPAFWDDNRRAQELIRERADLARVVARVTELGAREHRYVAEGGSFWTVMLDPEGNEFCVLR